MSRLRHRGRTLSASHASGGVYWMVRPSASRSARATPRSHVRSSATSFLSLVQGRMPRGQPAHPRFVERGLYPGAVRILVGLDKFKGTLTAAEAGEAIARGWRRADPG